MPHEFSVVCWTGGEAGRIDPSYGDTYEGGEGIGTVSPLALT